MHIVVHGEVEIWHHRKLTCDAVVKLTFPAGPTGGHVRYSVSWTKPDGQGRLAAAGLIHRCQRRDDVRCQKYG